MAGIATPEQGASSAGADEDHLRRLVASWGMVADFSFADLLLLRLVGQEQFTVAAHVRPTTGQTLYQQDPVGTVITANERPLVHDTWTTGKAHEANVQGLHTGEPIRARTIPVRRDGRLLAVIVREEALNTVRRPGRLERTYLQISDRLAEMIANGVFPFSDDADQTEMPRVGDGVLVIDAQRCINYASPNATSALNRFGVRMNPEGRTLAELGVDPSLVSDAWATAQPATRETERPSARPRSRGLGVQQVAAAPSVTADDDGASVVVQLRCIPLLTGPTEVTGAVVLVRDVSDLRRRDRLLRSKDATIREVHHRVKNNLQTISALLRLQGRRLSSPEAKQAIDDSVRRIRSMALVHETLARDTRESAPFDEIIRPLVRMVEEGLQPTERPVRFIVTGVIGDLAAEIATPLAVVLVELLQNAMEHGYPPAQAEGKGGRGGRVDIELEHRVGELRVVVRDDGVGFPPGFSLANTASLGLTIVRTLITSELGGIIVTRNNPSPGHGAVVELRLPSTAEPRIGH